MEVDKIIEFISRGRTDYIFDLLKQPNWKGIEYSGQTEPLNPGQTEPLIPVKLSHLRV